MTLPLWTDSQFCESRNHCVDCQGLGDRAKGFRASLGASYTLTKRDDGTVDCPVGNQAGCDPCGKPARAKRKGCGGCGGAMQFIPTPALS